MPNPPTMSEMTWKGQESNDHKYVLLYNISICTLAVYVQCTCTCTCPLLPKCSSNGVSKESPFWSKFHYGIEKSSVDKEEEVCIEAGHHL